MREWRLLTTNPSPCPSSRARAKLWLPPVSSNGLKRTRPTRPNEPLSSRSMTAVRAPTWSTSRTTWRTRSRWLPSTASSDWSSLPRVMLSSRAAEAPRSPDQPDDGEHEGEDDDQRPPTMGPMLAVTSSLMSIARPPGLGRSLASDDWRRHTRAPSDPVLSFRPPWPNAPDTATSRAPEHPQSAPRDRLRRARDPCARQCRRPARSSRTPTTMTTITTTTTCRCGAAPRLTEAEIARAAELEAEAIARERAAIAESLRRRARARRASATRPPT